MGIDYPPWRVPGFFRRRRYAARLGVAPAGIAGMRRWRAGFWAGTEIFMKDGRVFLLRPFRGVMLYDTEAGRYVPV